MSDEILTEEQELQARIAFLEGRMKQCELYVSFWMTRINSGEASQRERYHCDKEKTPCTSEENIKDAVNVMKTHIQNYGECLENRDDLIRKLFDLQNRNRSKQVNLLNQRF